MATGIETVDRDIDRLSIVNRVETIPRDRREIHREVRSRSKDGAVDYFFILCNRYIYEVCNAKNIIFKQMN